MPYWRLSSFYFFYFASLGALVFYWNPYLNSLGFNDAEIGELMAIIMATRIIAPNLWGYIADRTGKRMQIVRLGSLLCALFFLGVLLGDSYWWLAIVMTAFSFFWNASLPQFEVTTLNHLGENTSRYNHIRIWGSIGFIIVVLALGFAFDLQLSYSYLPWILAFLFFLIFTNSLLVPEAKSSHLRIDSGPIFQTIKRPQVLYLFVVVCLLQASHMPYYIYYVRYLKLYGFSHAEIGFLISLGVLAEILIFLVMRRLYTRFSYRKLIIIALSLTTLRWLITATYPTEFSIMLGSQLLHAASFGIMHVVCIELIHQYFVGPHQGRGQALYSSMSFGVGGVIGSLYSGYLWQTWGAQTQGSILFYTAMVISFVALLVAYFGIEKYPNK